MPTQQVIARPARAAMFLVFTVSPGGEAAVRELLPGLSGITRGVSFRAPEDDLRCIVGVGSDLWNRLYDEQKPAGLHPFTEQYGATHTAPATPGDLLFHIAADHLDICFELAKQLTLRLESAARVVDEVHGFKFFDQRDLLGFVDGTANPEGTAAQNSALIADTEGRYAGGSYVIVQKYLHDLDAWNALSVEEQEAAIGRSKLDDIEKPDDQKAPNSHLALNTIVDDTGVEHDIYRENMPFGRVGEGEYGTYFIGYASDSSVTEQMLHNMFVGKPAGNHDRILDFSTAVTGCLFFVPAATLLDSLDTFAPANPE